jgi:transposase InsO family protein
MSRPGASACRTAGGRPGAGLLFHSDQGCTYASEDYQVALGDRGIICSMSRRGNCYDNAVLESFFSKVKSGLADRFGSYAEAKTRPSTTSRCTTTNGVATRRSARSVRPRLSALRRRCNRGGARRHPVTRAVLDRPPPSARRLATAGDDERLIRLDSTRARDRITPTPAWTC